MKKFPFKHSILAIAVSVLASPAFAQTYDWGGPYVGLHAGYGAADFDGLFDSADALNRQEPLGGLDPSGFVGGVQAGFNIQNGNFVYGLEADISASGMDDSGGDFVDGTHAADIDFQFSIRARAGWAMGANGQVLPYLTAGFIHADADFTMNHLLVATTPPTSMSVNGDGVVVGGGVEVAFPGMGITTRIEGLYEHFDDSYSPFGAGVFDADPNDVIEFKNKWVVRVGVNVPFP